MPQRSLSARQAGNLQALLDRVAEALQLSEDAALIQNRTERPFIGTGRHQKGADAGKAPKGNYTPARV